MEADLWTSLRAPPPSPVAMTPLLTLLLMLTSVHGNWLLTAHYFHVCFQMFAEKLLVKLVLDRLKRLAHSTAVLLFLDTFKNSDHTLFRRYLTLL